MALFGKKKKSAAKKTADADQSEPLDRDQARVPKKGAKPANGPQNSSSGDSEPKGASASNALFATLSHELRTPLNGVLGMAQLLNEEFGENEKLETLESCALHMQSVLRALTNLAKVYDRWGNLPEHREWINLSDQIEQIKKNIGYRAASRRLKIAVQHENKTLRLRGDYDHLKNIIEPAILGSLECTKVNSGGDGDTLSISWKRENDSIKLVIENPRETMTRDRGQRITEATEIANGAMDSRIRLEFLYWAVSVGLLEHYDGAMIATEMDEGQGVRTTITFKMEMMEASPSSKKPIGGLGLSSGDKPKSMAELPFCMRVLVVEDDPVSRQLMNLLLKRVGQESVVVENGQAALDLLENDKEFDMILMDIDMPVLDGLGTTQAIRLGEAGESAMSLPIVAVTAFNTLSDESKFKKAGMDYFLSKPVAMKDFRSVLLDVNRKMS
jgi:CheY-like chemotaxis protein